MNTHPHDDLGHPVPLDNPPTRVVSLVPSLTEAVAATAPGALAAATDYCTHPTDLDVPRVGGSKYPKLDRIRAANPDLVIANAEENRPDDVQALRDSGIPVWVTEAAATVPAAITSMRRLFTHAFDAAPPWLAAAEQAWADTEPEHDVAVIPVWRKPWVVIGRATFAGDVLHRLGIRNAYAGHPDRYPRPPLAELREAADLVILPDEPYAFTATDGPEAFPGHRVALVTGRYLTWYGPSLVEARDQLRHQLSSIA